MKILWKKIWSTFLLVGGVLSVFIIPTIYYQVKNYSNYNPWVNFGRDPATEVIISWESVQSEIGQIKYGKDFQKLNYTTQTNHSNVIHHVFLRNLIPNTHYYYKISSQNIPKEKEHLIFRFKTAKAPMQDSLRILALSDTQQTIGSGFHPRVAEKLGQECKLSDPVDFVLHAGDIVGRGDKIQDWRNFFDTATDYLGKTVFIPTIGNHDVYDSKIDGISSSSAFSQYFPISLNPPQIYYSINASYVHLSILDFRYGTQQDLASPQINWLREDLSNAQTFPFRILLFHSPVYSSGFYGDNWVLQERLTPILRDYNVTLVVSGHDHHYERIIRGDITYIVLGGGGAIQDPHDAITKGSQALSMGPSYTEILINQTDMQISAINLAGEIFDQTKIQAGGK